MKRCPHCGTDKPLTLEFYGRHRHQSSGWNSWCRACCAAKAREARRDPAVLLRRLARLMRNECKQ